MKTQTILLRALVFFIAAVCAVLFGVRANTRLCAFCAEEDGTLVIGYYDSLILAERDGTVKTVPSEFLYPFSMRSDGSKIIIYTYRSYMVYNSSTGRFGECVLLSDDTVIQDLKKPVIVGNSKYCCRNSFGRYRFYEVTPEGEEVLRYEMPVWDYAVKLGRIVFIPLFFAATVLYLLHINKNYKRVRSGLFIKLIPKE